MSYKQDSTTDCGQIHIIITNLLSNRNMEIKKTICFPEQKLWFTITAFWPDSVHRSKMNEQRYDEHHSQITAWWQKHPYMQAKVNYDKKIMLAKRKTYRHWKSQRWNEWEVSGFINVPQERTPKNRILIYISGKEVHSSASNLTRPAKRGIINKKETHHGNGTQTNMWSSHQDSITIG